MVFLLQVRSLENICSRLWALLKIFTHIFYDLHKSDCRLHPVMDGGFSLQQPSPLPGVTLTTEKLCITSPLPLPQKIHCAPWGTKPGEHSQDKAHSHFYATQSRCVQGQFERSCKSFVKVILTCDSIPNTVSLRGSSQAIKLIAQSTYWVAINNLENSNLKECCLKSKLLGLEKTLRAHLLEDTNLQIILQSL